MISTLELLKYDNNVLKMTMDLKCDQDSMEVCMKKFKNYCTVDKVEDILEKLQSKAQKSVTDKIVEDLQFQETFMLKIRNEVDDLKNFQFTTETDMKDKPSQHVVN